MSAKLSILPFHPSIVVMDGQVVRIRVTRFDVDAFKIFRRDYLRIGESETDRAMAIRVPGEEQTKEPTKDGGEAFVIADDEIARRRRAEMTAEQRVAHDQRQTAEEDFAQRFIERSIAAHVTVEPGDIEIDEGVGEGPRPLVHGAELVKYFGGRREVMIALITAIWLENILTPAVKNLWRSPSASGGSSDAPAQTAVGATPAPPATNVEPAPSVTPAAATASTEACLSGEMVSSN